jgi:hypothetical protein
MALEAARTRLVLAQAVASTARHTAPDEARALLTSAHASFAATGAALDLARAEQLQAAWDGARPAEGAALLPTLPAPGVLARGEGRVSPAATLPATGGARTVRQAWVLEHLRTAGMISPRAYSATLGVSVDTALLDLRALVEQGLLRAEGTTRDRRYHLAGTTEAR